MKVKAEHDGDQMLFYFDYHDGEPETRDNPGCPDYIELSSIWAKVFGSYICLFDKQMSVFYKEYGEGSEKKGKAELEAFLIKSAKERYQNER
jgi:hypothetical protein